MLSGSWFTKIRIFYWFENNYSEVSMIIRAILVWAPAGLGIMLSDIIHGPVFCVSWRWVWPGVGSVIRHCIRKQTITVLSSHSMILMTGIKMTFLPLHLIAKASLEPPGFEPRSLVTWRRWLKPKIETTMCQSLMKPRNDMSKLWLSWGHKFRDTGHQLSFQTEFLSMLCSL